MTCKLLANSRYIVLFIILFLSLSLHAQNYDTVQIKSVQLTESIYMLEGMGGNIGVCTGDDGVFVIDDQYAPLSGKIKKAIATFTDKPVQFIINTHYHGDHMGGNENFSKEGAIIVSHDNVRKRVRANELKEGNEGEKENISYHSLAKVTFTESMTFHYNGQTIEVFYLGNAHTDGDVIIYFKEANVLHMGDVFVRYGFPYIDKDAGGNINGMITALDHVIEMTDQNTKIIPGHGRVANSDDMIEFHDMLKTIRDRVKLLVDEGRSFEEILEADPTRGFDEEGNVTRFLNTVYQNIIESGTNGSSRY